MLEKLQEKVSAKSTEFSQEEERIAATTPFAMVNMRQRILKLDWEDKEQRLDELSEHLSEAAKDYENDLTFGLLSWFKTQWIPDGTRITKPIKLNLIFQGIK